MAKVQEIGPYSAYAIAVKYGYQGTEEEWVQEQEANRKAAEAAAAAAAQSAKDAAASASGAAQSGQQAVQSIKDAQTTAVQAIDTAKQQAVQAAQAEAEKAATSAGQAASSAAEAAQSATNAAAEVGKVQSAGAAAVQAVQQAQSTATEAVSDAQQSATQAVSEAQATAVSAVQEAGTTQTSAVESAGTAAVSAVSNAKTEALSQISTAGTAQVSAVGTAGADAVEDVNDAKTAALEEIDAANAALPSPTQSDVGKVPTVKADGSAYELAGPYAPLSAAIRPTASGNPVSIADSVEWSLQGLKVYGKSTQDGTPSPENPVPIVSAGDSGSIGLTVSGANLFQPIENGYLNNTDGSVSEDKSAQATDYIPVGTFSKLYYYIQNFDSESTHNYSFRVGYYDRAKTWIYNTGITAMSTVVSFPEGTYYIRVSAATYGQTMVSFTQGTLYEPNKSQSLTVSTPNGLPGIPVDSDGNYTDAEGQQLICDEVNDSKRVHRIEQIEFDGSPDESWQIAFNENAQRNFFYIALKKMALRNSTGNNVLICSSYKYYQYGYNDPGANNTVCFQSNNLTLVCTTSSFTSVDEWRQFLTENAMTLIYAIANPIETPISPEELAAYRALHTYDGTTVVSTAEEVAGIEVRYVADGEKYIDRKISEAITSAAATQLASYDALSDAIHEA